MSWQYLRMINTAPTSSLSGSLWAKACPLRLEVIWSSITCAPSWLYLLLGMEGNFQAQHSMTSELSGPSVIWHYHTIWRLWVWPFDTCIRYKGLGSWCVLNHDDFCRPSRISMQAANSWRSARFLSWTRKPSESSLRLWWASPRLRATGKSALSMHFG